MPELKAWVTVGTQNPVLGTLPKEAYVVRTHIHCTVAFNAGSGNTIELGYVSDTDAYCTATSVSSTGVKSPTAGVGIGRDGTSRQVKALYSYGGAAPTTGKTLCIIEFFLNPPQP